MLILFDIDGTLLLTQRAGSKAMLDAARELFGDAFTFDGVEIAGRIDPLIWADAAKANGLADPEAHHDRFRAAYARHFAARLRADHTVTLLPGVARLLDALADLDHVTVGLLTGNYPETGRMKIKAAGLDPDVFAIAVWGIDGAHRRELPCLAMEQYAASYGHSIEPREVLIVGDTPHDIDCAKASGCRCLAVATGMCCASELAAHEPELLVDDLSDTPSILAWMLNR